MEEGWRRALPPSQLSIEWIQAIQRLFLEGTGEEYFFGSVQALPVPDWDGNFMLFDSNEPNHETMRGVLWTSPFKADIVRIVSFVLDQGARGHDNLGHHAQVYEGSELHVSDGHPADW